MGRLFVPNICAKRNSSNYAFNKSQVYTMRMCTFTIHFPLKKKTRIQFPIIVNTRLCGERRTARSSAISDSAVDAKLPRAKTHIHNSCAIWHGQLISPSQIYSIDDHIAHAVECDWCQCVMMGIFINSVPY